MPTYGRLNPHQGEATLPMTRVSMRLLIINCSTNAVLLLSSSMIGLVGLELAARIFFPEYDPSGQVRFVRGHDGTRIGQPGAVLRQFKNTGDYDVEVRFNTWGFRDDKALTQATDRDYFVVGDSFAFGWGVEAK